jgi:hypothetical protein
LKGKFTTLDVDFSSSNTGSNFVKLVPIDRSERFLRDSKKLKGHLFPSALGPAARSRTGLSPTDTAFSAAKPLAVSSGHSHGCQDASRQSAAASPHHSGPTTWRHRRPGQPHRLRYSNPCQVTSKEN